jgi:hypothetical protein
MESGAAAAQEVKTAKSGAEQREGGGLGDARSGSDVAELDLSDAERVVAVDAEEVNAGDGEDDEASAVGSEPVQTGIGWKPQG